MILALLACFKPYADLADLDFEEVPFDAPGVEVEARIRSVQTTLRCPDGQYARFFALWPTEVEGPLPLAVGFHSGSFDYKLDPGASTTSPLYGATWQASSRLSRDWADLAVWTTLGMYPGELLEGEEHQGALPAALVNAGVAQLWPGNCWGDLWHNEEGYQENDLAAEGLPRNGRTLAWWMLRYAYDLDFASTQQVELPFLPGEELYLVGLGEGGRAVPELILREGMPRLAGAIVDSAPDRLSPYLDPTYELNAEARGLSRIVPSEEDRQQIDRWSLYELAESAPPAAPTGTGGTTGQSSALSLDGAGQGRMPARVAWVWSSVDPRMPRAAAEESADALEARPEAWVMDRRDRRHVFSNADPALAQALTSFVRTGERIEPTAP